MSDLRKAQVLFRFHLRQWYDCDYRNRSVVRHYTALREVEQDVENAMELAKIFESGNPVSLTFTKQFSEKDSFSTPLTLRLADGERSNFVWTESGVQIIFECAPIDMHFSDACLAAESGKETLEDCFPGWTLTPEIFDVDELCEDDRGEAVLDAYEK